MLYRFADCLLDTGSHVFTRGGTPVHVEPQVFDLLTLLARSGGDLVSHDTLVANVWKGLNVSDAAISTRITAARKAVGDNGRAQRVIETVPRRGFRLAVPVTVEATEAPSGHHHAEPPASLPTLTVLPFRYQAIDALDILADGIVDEITTALGRVGEFHVIARQSALALPDAIDIPTAARLLGADYLVEGSVRRGRDRVRIAVNLLDAQGRSIWASRYDETAGDLFELQDHITMQVAGQLPVKLRGAEIARANRLSEESGEVRAWILRALPHFWAHEREANNRAIRLLSHALEVDADDVRAMAYKAWALAQRPVYLWSDNAGNDRAEARALASRAAARVSDDAPALVAISAAFSLTLSDPAPALAFAHRAIEIDPNNAWGRMRLGWALNYSGRPAEGLPEFDHARRLSPLDPFLYNMRIGAAISHVGLGNLDTAIAIVTDTIAGTPQVTWAYRILASICRRMGDAAGEAAATRKLVETHPGLTMKRLGDALPPGMIRQRSTYIPWRLLPEGAE